LGAHYQQPLFCNQLNSGQATRSTGVKIADPKGMIASSQREAPFVTERTKLLLALLLTVGAIYFWWPRALALLEQPSPRRQQTPSFSIKNEQTWMAGEVGRQIAETVAFAQGKWKPGRVLQFEQRSTYVKQQLRHQLGVSFKDAEPAEAVVQTQDYFLSPEMFAPWVQALTKALHVDRHEGSPGVDQEYIGRLTTPRPEVLIQEDLRISQVLTKDPLSAKAHEEAALLIGSLALRETALEFMDARPALTRMSTHLAIAKGIGGNLSACGELAEALLCSLTGRQAAALQIVDALQERAGLPAELPLETAARWGKALKLCNTGDYRLLDHPENGSLLERLECFRALRYNLNSAAATAYAEKYPLERLAEWSSRIMAGSISVEDGNRWASRALETELEECAAEYRAYHGQVLQEKDLANALNARWQQFTPSKSTLEVLGWGAWAELREREVCELVEETFYWMNDLLGIPDEAQNFRKKVTEQLGTMELFPLVSFDESNPPKGNTNLDDKVGRLLIAHPEKFTFSRWNKVREPLMRASPNTAVFKLIAPMMSWFQPTFLEGTAYDALRRRPNNELLSLPRQELERLKQIAPYDFNICWACLRKSTDFRPTFEQTAAEFSELAGYNLGALHAVAESAKDDPERYERLYELICRVEPDRYVDLGDYLRNQGNEEKAARAYQSAFDHAPDRVRVSNNCEWLINYYFDHGRKSESFAVAKYAAEVYSAAGLETMAKLLERTGDLAGAEEYFRKIEERYSGHSDTTMFYLRNQVKSARYAAAAKEAVARMFPDGIEFATLNNLSAPPADGVVVSGWSNVTRRIGLEPGDVLTAIDGQRIHNRKQYYFVRDASNDPNISYIIWRRGKYIEIKANLPGRKIIATINDYPGR
jgi:hypothetical protein